MCGTYPNPNLLTPEESYGLSRTRPLFFSPIFKSSMRIRTIKPAFYKDEKLAELPPLSRILFTGLWGLADSEGRLEYRPRYIKIEVLPYDDCDVPEMLKALEMGRQIQIYGAGRRSFIYVINFKKHQRLSGKEAEIKSEFPIPPPIREAKGKQRGKIGTHPGSNGEAPGKRSMSRKGKEGKGVEGKGLEGKGLPVAKDATEDAQVALQHLSPQAEFIERFKASYEAMTGEKFKADKHHFIIAAKLIKDHGYDAAVLKAKTLGTLCRDQSTWFTKGGWGDYTIEKLSSQWNSILPSTRGDTPEGKAKELLSEMKKQEELSAIASGRSN